jgi:hypothetical protein
MIDMPDHLPGKVRNLIMRAITYLASTFPNQDSLHPARMLNNPIPPQDHDK